MPSPAGKKKPEPDEGDSTLHGLFDPVGEGGDAHGTRNRDLGGVDPVGGAANHVNGPAPATDGDPVTLGSGELVYRVTDLAMPDTGALPLALTRTYRSGRPFAGELGRNWEHNFEELFFLIIPRPPKSTLFPYTTLFR